MVLKKRILSSVCVIVMAVVCAMAFSGDTCANINGAESSIIGAACSTFYYHGEYYRVKQTYINQLINALDTEYDLDQSQANACIDYIYNNIGSGINQGYLYKVELEEENTETENNGSDDISAPSDQQTTEVADGAVSDDNNKPNNIIEGAVIIDDSKKKSKEDVLKETTDLAASMGVSVNYDNSKNGITITDKTGNVLVTTTNAVKNTGFNLNSLIYFGAFICVAIISLLIIAVRGGLFEKTDED